MKKCVRVRGISTLVGSWVQKSPKPPLPAPESEDKSLYRRLSALGGTGGSVADTLNEYLSEGHFVKKYDLWSAIKQLRRFGKLNHALQVCSLPFSNFFFSIFLLDHCKSAQTVVDKRFVAQRTFDWFSFLAQNSPSFTYFHGLLSQVLNILYEPASLLKLRLDLREKTKMMRNEC